MRLTLFRVWTRRLSTATQSLPWQSTANTGYNFELTDVQTEILQIAKKFSQDEIIPKATHYDQSGTYPTDIVKKAWKLGLTNLTVPTRYGGRGLGTTERCLVAEAAAHGCSGIQTAIEGNALGQTPIILAGSELQKKSYLGRMAEEPLHCAYCITEPGAGSDVANVKTRAVKRGAEYVINGQKIWITNAGVANWYFVLARTDPDPKTPASKAFTGFVVDRDTPGVTVGRKEWNMGQRASDTRAVAFEDVIVPKENVVGAEGMGFKIVMKAFDQTRCAISAGAVGLAQRALDEAVDFVTKGGRRMQQSTEMTLAEMAVGVENARMATVKAAWEADQDRPNSYYASVAKVVAAEVANRNATAALQLFEESGLSVGCPIEKLVRDAKIYQIYGGTTEIQKVVISRLLIKRN